MNNLRCNGANANSKWLISAEVLLGSDLIHVKADGDAAAIVSTSSVSYRSEKTRW